MLDYSNSSTEYIILDSESVNVIKAPSPSTIKIQEFPDVPQEVLKTFIIKQEGILTERDDTDDKRGFSQTVYNSSDSSHVLFSKIKSVPQNMSEACSRGDGKRCMAAINHERRTLKVFDVYDIVKLSNDHQVVSTRFVSTKKFSEKTESVGCKVRLVVKEFGFETK